MTKTECTAAIEADLTAANILCAELRTLRNFKKIGKSLPDAEKMVSFDMIDRTIMEKESELQNLRSALGKNRRILKKLAEIEAIETGKPLAPKSRNAHTEKKLIKAKAGKSTKKEAVVGIKSTQAKKGDVAPEQTKIEKPAA